MPRSKLTRIVIVISAIGSSLACESIDFYVGGVDGAGSENSLNGGSTNEPEGVAGAGFGGDTAGCDCLDPGVDCEPGACETRGGLTQLAVGLESMCAIRRGALWCWGRNYGVQPFEVWPAPTQLGSSTTWRAVSSATGESYCALDDQGALYCWGGDNGQGILAGAPSSTFPQRVDGGPFVALYHGSGHGCALSPGLQLSCWGRNTDGELGIGNTNDQFAPIEVSAGTFSTAAMGWGHTCAITSAGSLYCWGRNDFGQLGLGHRDQVLEPTVVDAKTWRLVSASEFSTCAVDTEGRQFCWGENMNGRLWTSDEGAILSPALVFEGPVVGISAGRQRTCSFDASDVLRCAGLDAALELRSAEVLSTSGLDLIEIHSGNEHSCLLGSGDVYCWGPNNEGLLGLGDQTPRLVPTLVPLP